MPSWEDNERDYREHNTSGKPPAPNASDAAKKGHQDYIARQTASRQAGAETAGNLLDQYTNAWKSSDTNSTSHSDAWETGYPILDKGIPAIILGSVGVGVACIFSETARTVFKAVGTGIYNIGYYGYETAATAVNNIDLLAAGGTAVAVTTIASFVLDDKYKILDKKRNLIGAFVIGALATTSAVYATATQARKLGYQSVLPQWTERGAAISEWGRTRPITPPTATSSSTAPRATGTPMAIVPTPAHYTVDDLLNLTSSLRAGGYTLTPEQIKQLASEGVTVKGEGRNTTVTVKPDYFPEPRTPLPPNAEKPYQRWQNLYKNLP